MKRLSFVLPSVLISLCFFTITFLYADGPGTTTAFTPPPLNGIDGLQSTAYNSQNNQFIFTWLSGASEINYVIFDASGNVVVSQNTIVGGSSSSPTACYNSTDNQYLVSWIGGTVAIDFSILDDAGNTLVLSTINLTPGFILNGDPMCCYNSTDNQYCITWTAFDPGTSTSATYFAIVNADESIAQGQTQIPSVSGQLTADFTDSFVTYNSQVNEYLFTWLSAVGGVNGVAFAIYDADGNAVVPAQIIPQNSSLNTNSHPPFSSYNSTNNQYFITWSAIDNGFHRGFFAIYNRSGVEIVPATEIVTSLSGSGFFSAPVCSYNIRNNQYFVSWDDSFTQALCSIFDANGDVIASDIVIPLLSGNAPIGLVFNSFNPQDDEYFITWYSSGNTCAYFNIFTTSPSPAAPSNLKGINGTNRFINFIDYTTQLSWTASTSTNVASYNVYRNGTLIATLPAYATSYIAHNKPRALTTYSVAVVDAFGDTSTLVSITL